MENIPSLRTIKESRLNAVVNTKSKWEATALVRELGITEGRLYDEKDFVDVWDAFKENTCYRIIAGKIDVSDSLKYYQSINEKIYKFSDLFATGGTVSIHDLSTNEWYQPMCIEFKNGSYIKAIPNDDIIRGKTIKDTMNSLIDTWGKIGCTSFWMSPDEVDKAIKRLEEKNLKFTFYVTEGTRIDKTCNKTVPTMTTHIYSDSLYHGTATCDKADYSERQGVLEAFANAMLGGNFEREYNKAVKLNKKQDLYDRTCSYCGQVFDTKKECLEHEAWHVERRKARHERYLLRKRAKEIAFEEAAQKLAKEIIAEDKKK